MPYHITLKIGHLPLRHKKLGDSAREGHAAPGGQDVQFSQPLKLYSPGLQFSGCF